MGDLRERHSRTVTVREDQMVFAIPSSEEGVDEIVYIDGEIASMPSHEPVNLSGAWAGLVDGDDLFEAIERFGHETPPSLPISFID